MAKPKKRKTARKRKPSPKADKKNEVRERLKQYASAVDVPGGRVKPRLLSLLFCEFSSTTDDRKINLMGVFDRLFVDAKLRQSGRFFIYGRTAETFEDSLWVRVFDPDNEPQLEIKFDPPSPDTLERKDWPSDAPKQFQFAIPIQMKFEKTGTYWFDVAFRDFSLGGAGLVIELRKSGADQNATDAR